MWLSDRRTFLTLAAALPLAACGFAPALAPGGGLAGLRDRVRVADPQTRNDFAMKVRLEERLGLPDRHDFDLVVRVQIDESDAGAAVTNTDCT